MSNLIGSALGRYHILEQLGEGGMAVVYKAYDTRLERDVAVKVIRKGAFPPDHVEHILKRFEREAKALARLSHPNIMKVLDYGEHEGSPYLVMEYLQGGTLKDKMGKPIPWQEAVQLLLPIAEALDYAHSQNMIHRDVKPANILLTQRGQPMLTDFGIAKILDLEETLELTGTSAAIGTPEYMAPEQATAKHVDQRADIYSLGIVLYEMVTGRKPYTADTPMAILIMHAHDPLPSPKLAVPDLPVGMERILLKALAKKPEDRYQSMGEMVKAFENLQGGRGGQLAPKTISKDGKRKPNILMIILGLAALVLFAVFGLPSLTVKPVPAPAVTSTEKLKTFTPISATEALTLAPTSTLGPVEAGEILDSCDENDLCIYKHGNSSRLGLSGAYSIRFGSGSWSPDGAEIVFSGCLLSDLGGDPTRCEMRQNLFITSRDGKQIKPVLTGTGINAIDPAWSPDGQWIALHQMGSLTIVQPDRKGLKNLVDRTDACPFGIAWSPDSLRIAWIGGTCNANTNHSDTVWVINRDGTGINTIYKSDDVEVTGGQIAWSPDGKSVAVALESGVVYLIDASCAASPNGCDETSRTIIDRIPEHWMRNFYPQWAGESLQTSPSITLTNTFPGEALPPGSQITTVGVDAAMEVARVDPNGTQTLLTNNNGLDAHVAISPDGRRIAFWSDRDGGADIYAMNTDGTNVVRVTNNGNSVDPSWTPDGNGLFYVSFQPSGSSLNLLDVASGKIKTVASFAYGIVVPELTSNGSQVIFLRPPESGQWWTGEMYIMPVEGGEPVLLTQSMSVINQTTFPWSTFLQAPDHYLNNH